MDTNPRDVLKNLRKIASERELTAEEKQLGRIAAKKQGEILHQQAMAAAQSLHASEKKRLMASGYTDREAEAQIALEERQSLYDRGFFGPIQRCRISQPNERPTRSRRQCITKVSSVLVAEADRLLAI